MRRTQSAIDALKGDNFTHLSPKEKAQSLLHTLVYNFIGVKERATGNKPEVKFNVNSGDDFRIANRTGNNEYEASGFKSEFDDTSNQVRHFTGGLWAGYLYGSMGGYFGMNSNEKNRIVSGTGIVSSLLGILPRLFPTRGKTGSAPDIRLNAISTELGGYLRVGVFSHLAKKIKEKVCE